MSGYRPCCQSPRSTMIEGIMTTSAESICLIDRLASTGTPRSEGLESRKGAFTDRPLDVSALEHVCHDSLRNSACQVYWEEAGSCQTCGQDYRSLDRTSGLVKL